MRNIFYPSELISSTYRIDFERLYAEGYRGIIFDIDNTLVPHGAPADERAIRLFRRLKEIGFSCCLVSNNKRPRVEMFNRDVGVHIVWLAHKPLPGGYRKAMEMYGASPAETIFFGDQIFTDIWGANRAGIDSVLVKPVDKSTDEIQIVLKRFLEKPLIKAFFKRKGLHF